MQAFNVFHFVSEVFFSSSQLAKLPSLESPVERVATICLFPTARGSGSCTVCSYHSAGYNHEGLAISDRRILVDHFGFPLDLNLIFVWISKKSFP